jgi:drug/metabolite transporter (DMT)-like permease
MQSNYSVRAWVILIILSLIWGTSFFMIKKALTVFSPYQLASVRVLMVAILFSTFMFWFWNKITRQDYKNLFFAGFLGIVLSSILFPIAQQGVNSSITSVLNATYPIFVAVLGILFFNQRLNKFQIIGLLLGFMSVSILIMFNAQGELKWNFLAIFALLAVGCNALYALWVKYHLKHIEPFILTTAASSLMLPFGLLGLLLTDTYSTIQTHEKGYEGLLYITYLAVFATALGTWLYNYLLSISTTIFAGLVTYLIPIVSIAWGISDGETITFSQMLAILGVLAGIYLLSKPVKEKQKILVK